MKLSGFTSTVGHTQISFNSIKEMPVTTGTTTKKHKSLHIEKWEISETFFFKCDTIIANDILAPAATLITNYGQI